MIKTNDDDYDEGKKDAKEKSVTTKSQFTFGVKGLVSSTLYQRLVSL